MKKTLLLPAFLLAMLFWSCQKEAALPGLADLHFGPYAPFVPGASWTYRTTDIVCGDVLPDTSCTENIVTDTLFVEGDTVINNRLYKKVGGRFLRVEGPAYYQFLPSEDIRNGGAEIRYLHTDLAAWEDTLFWSASANAPFDFTVLKRKIKDQKAQIELAGNSYVNVIEVETLPVYQYEDRPVPGAPRWTWFAEGVGEIFYEEARFNAEYRRVLIDFRLE